MPLTINPELIENSEVQITTNTDGDLVIENRLNGQTITLTDEGVEVPALSAEEYIDATGTSYSDFSTLGGVTYTQATEPSDPEAGDTWYDTSSGIYRAYADLRSGLQWHPIPPVQVTEEAVTFEESDVSVTHDDTQVSDGSLSLPDPTREDSYTFSSFYSNDDNNEAGLIINPNEEIYAFEMRHTRFDSGLSLKLTVERVSDNTILGQTDFVDPTEGVIVYPSTTLTVGTEYAIYWETADGETVNTGRAGESGTVTSDDGTYDIVDGWEDGSSSTYPLACQETWNVSPILSGNALIEWDSGIPDGIKSWDLATYQATEDGETVTVDVLDLSETTRPDDNNDVSADEFRGIEITPSEDVSPIIVTLSSNISSVDTIEVRDEGGDLIADVSGSWDAGDEIEIGANLSANTSYAIGCNPDSHGYYDDPSYPYEEGKINITNGAIGIDSEGYNEDSLAWNFEVVKTRDVLFSDVGQNFDISTIDPSTDVKLRANLQRGNTDNNPTLDYAARRFTR